MPRKMDNYIIDLDSFMNIDNGNGILLSKYEIELLLKYDIDYRNYSDIESLLKEIDDTLENDYIEELEDIYFKDMRLKIEKYANENNIVYDPDSGWEDFDILIQEMISGEGTEVLPIGYQTPAITQGVSTFSNLPERCIENTSKVLSKWGFDLVRLDLKKGIFNSKVNWIKTKKAISENVPLKSLVKPIQITESNKESIRNIMNSDLEPKEKKLKIEKLLGQ